MEKEKKKINLYKVAIARKINAIISLICSLLILTHGTYDAIWMICRGKISTLSIPVPFILVVFLVIHIILSIVTAILASSPKSKEKARMYQKENIKTLIQRASGILIILLLIPHVIGMKQFLNPKILHSIVHPLFFLLVYGHTAISFSKAFITLGIGNAKFIKVIDILSTILCSLIFIASIIGLYLVMYARWLG